MQRGVEEVSGYRDFRLQEMATVRHYSPGKLMFACKNIYIKIDYSTERRS